jgi:hypothetical protein
MLFYIYCEFAQSQIVSLLLCVVVIVYIWLVVAVFWDCQVLLLLLLLFGAKMKRNPANEFLNVEQGSNVSGPGYYV